MFSLSWVFEAVLVPTRNTSIIFLMASHICVGGWLWWLGVGKRHKYYSMCLPLKESQTLKSCERKFYIFHGNCEMNCFHLSFTFLQDNVFVCMCGSFSELVWMVQWLSELDIIWNWLCMYFTSECAFWDQLVNLLVQYLCAFMIGWLRSLPGKHMILTSVSLHGTSLIASS